MHCFFFISAFLVSTTTARALAQSINNQYQDIAFLRNKDEATQGLGDSSFKVAVNGNGKDNVTPAGDGSRRTILPDGTVTTRYEDGTMTIEFPSGRVRMIFPDGSIVTRETDDTYTINSPNGKTFIEHADGTIETKFRGGLTRITSPDGTIKITNSKGDVMTKNPGDKRVIITGEDGTTQILDPDGSSTVMRPNGSTTNTDASGKSTTTDREGNVIPNPPQLGTGNEDNSNAFTGTAVVLSAAFFAKISDIFNGVLGGWSNTQRLYCAINGGC